MSTFQQRGAVHGEACRLTVVARESRLDWDCPANPESHCAPQADGAQPSTASQRDNGWQWMTAL